MVEELEWLKARVEVLREMVAHLNNKAVDAG